MSSPPLLMSMIQTAPSGVGGAGAALFQFFPLLLVFVIFYVLVMRPQSVRAKQHQAEIMAVKKGDEVVTGGGHIGKVTKVADSEVEVEFASGQRHRVVKSTLAEVRRPGGSKPAND